MGVVVRRHLQHQSLVRDRAAEPVELAARCLEHRDAGLGGQLERLAHPVVAVDALGDVERGRRHPGPQRLDDRVAPGHRLRGRRPPPRERGDDARLDGVGSTSVPGACCPPASRPAPVAPPGGWCARSPWASAPCPASALRRWPPEPTLAPFFEPGLRFAPRRALLPAIRTPGPSVHRGPSGVSSTAMPAAVSRSRMRSAAAKSLRARASVRSSSATCDEPVDHAVQVGARRRRRPRRRQRVEAEHVEHRAHRREVAAQRVRRPVERRACCPRGSRPAAQRAPRARPGRRPSPRRTRRRARRRTRRRPPRSARRT